MACRVLEREVELSMLADVARIAATGRGCVVLVSGEAGIGKSSLVDAVRSRLPAEGRIFVGHCDDMSTPRVLGPFRDLIGIVGTELSKVLREGGDRDATVAALHRELDWPGHPTILAIEDVHWADEATLDVLRYLIRRIADLPVVLLLTYRDDELTRDHRLRELLGLAATIQDTRRLPLRRLSAEAVRSLSTSYAGADADEIYSVTGGNPFFVHEVLTLAPAGGVPPTVVDAVLARLRGLDESTRDAVERLSVIPSTIQRWQVDALIKGGLSDLAGAEERGLLAVTPGRVVFRHQLTRCAVLDALPTARRAALNAEVLAVLEANENTDVAQLVHHAAEAGDKEAILHYGPEAARAAARDGAHRQASSHYSQVLAHRDALTNDELADLLQASAIESYTVGDLDRNALADQESCVSIRREADDAVALAISLRWLSRIRWWCGERAGAEAAGDECVKVAEAAGDERLLAWALSNLAQLSMLAHRTADAQRQATEAIALAREVGDTVVLAHALNNLGTARWIDGDFGGRDNIEEGLRIAIAAGHTEEAVRSYCNLIWELITFLDPAEADRVFKVAIEYAEESEHLVFSKYIYVEKGMIELAGARWDDAIAYAERGLDAPDPIRCAALITISRAGVRSGVPREDYIAEAWKLAQDLDEMQRVAPAAAMVCEAAWLRGDISAIAEIARPIFEETMRHGAKAYHAGLAYWLTAAGESVELPESDHPYALLARGDWRASAATWSNAGYPYEAAFALSHSDDPEVLLDALARLDALGATPLARVVRGKLRDLGVERVPRGPIPSTRDNVAGLTSRQLEVLRLMASGLSNADIADSLVVSVRTVDNHVATVLQKLDARSRAEAVARAREQGWSPE